MFQAAADQLEGLPDLLVQRLRQLFVDRGLYLRQAVLLLGLHPVKICGNGRAYLLHALGIGTLQVSHTAFELPQPCVHATFHLFQALCLVVPGLALVFRQQIAQHLHLVLGVGGDLLPQSAQRCVILRTAQFLHLHHQPDNGGELYQTEYQ